ncbi:MAG TPA: folylpolyglutamate synthase/dihydrofolate synthase family protein [Urbifossiella sp.]|nr:folylpolyglutamate synthase/dihydrofolate synthase family protein [Urbifossiella sp.]
MTYDEALAYWYGRINFEVRAAGPDDLKLERMQALLHRLGDPHRRLRIVHITGTKGKGSTAAMLAAILQKAGHRVGLFTSPHLTHVEERIQVDGSSISHEELAECMAEVAAAAAGMPPPTFFEIGTALGFLHFAQKKCDLAIIEVGLGGRFDSTNVCTPLVSIITNVGFDHMAQLGNTLEAIAYEKAGIIKRGVPVVSGVTQSGPRDVVARVAREFAAPLWDAKDFLPPPEIAVGLLGAHQRENAACAIAAIERLRDAHIPVPSAAIRDGLASVRWPARIEVRSRRPLVILDTAHNVPSAEALVQTLAESFPDVGRKAVAFAVSSDKQYPEIIRTLATYFDSFHMTRYGTNPRATPPEKLADTLRQIDGTRQCRTYAASKDAWAAARAAMAYDDLLCATGSMFLAGELQGS